MRAPGALRDDVRVVFADKAVRIAYALWEVSLPADWVAAHADVAAFLNGQGTRDELSQDIEVASVVTLLEAQGCLVAPPLADAVSLCALRARFDALRSNWYAAYYAHPLWDRLRTGEASRNELVAYLLHNYHISRAAGAVAARMATRGPAEWRDFFAHDAASEYSHCDTYYLVQSAPLGCSPDALKTYVPLPSSTAFEQLTLAAAERDPIAHLLIAYLQESSVMFRADTDVFYADVERAYGLDGFFRPWQAHIAIDLVEEHARGIATLFDRDHTVSGNDAACGLATAWAAFHFLCSSLDDVVAERRPDDAIVLRRPLMPKARYVGSEVAGFAEASPDIVRCAARTRDTRYLTSEIARSALAALAVGRSHDEILIAGDVHEALRAHPPAAALPASPWTVALANFLAESAIRPLEWAALLDLVLCRLASFGIGVDAAAIRRRLDGVAVTETPGLATQLFRLDELIERWARTDDSVSFPVDL